MQSWIILIVATLLLVAVLYPLIKRPVHAALTAAVIFTLGFQIYAWWDLGYMDPFWPSWCPGACLSLSASPHSSPGTIWSSSGRASTTVSAADEPIARAPKSKRS